MDRFSCFLLIFGRIIRLHNVCHDLRLDDFGAIVSYRLGWHLLLLSVRLALLPWQCKVDLIVILVIVLVLRRDGLLVYALLLLFPLSLDRRLDIVKDLDLLF